MIILNVLIYGTCSFEIIVFFNMGNNLYGMEINISNRIYYDILDIGILWFLNTGILMIYSLRAILLFF